jgi:hypothetical protein
MSIDPFGDRLDADSIEQAALATLQAWLPDHLAHQERRKSARLTALGYSGTHLPLPGSWPLVDEFDIEAHEKLPAVVLVSPGTDDKPDLQRDGVLRQTWRIEVAAICSGKTEREARLVASVYLAAIKGAMRMDRTLGGIAEQVYITGRDDHAYGTTEAGSRRAIYGCPFAVVARDQPNTQPITSPSPNPYVPPAAPALPDTAEFTVEALEEPTP